MPAAPHVPNRWPTWRILDTVVTIALFGVYSVVVLGLLYFSLFWVMATDSCGANDCDYDKLSTAYVLNDVGGIIAFLVTLVVAVVLMVRRTPAFWLPLLGGLVQAGLFLAAMQQLSGVSPA
ncbi:Vitamin K epoxide reductase family protein [Tsukamurella ocularis]